MKEKFLKDQEKALQDAIDAFMDDDYQLEEYYASLQPGEAEFTAASQEEVQAESENQEEQIVVEVENTNLESSNEAPEGLEPTDN